MSVEEYQVSQSRLEQAFEVRQIGELRYEGVKPLNKPSLTSRGVYGGNLCGQSLLVAMETVPEGFTPHSLHSYFVKAGDDSMPCQYEVEQVSTSKNFANRLIRVVQKGGTKYLVMISLTRKNSLKQATATFQQEAAKGKGSVPLDFQKPPPRQFSRYQHDELETRHDHDHTRALQHKFAPDFYNSKLAEREELQKSAAERELFFWIRIDDQLRNNSVLQKLKYAGFGVVLDSLYLTSLLRILHLPISRGLTSGGKGEHFFLVLLDHSIYFHDDDFDPTKWCFFNFSAPRFSNNRVLLQGNYYSEDGKLFATIAQEALVYFHSGSDLKAKL
jgi:acyl-CoA thioesterase II